MFIKYRNYFQIHNFYSIFGKSICNIKVIFNINNAQALNNIYSNEIGNSTFDKQYLYDFVFNYNAMNYIF